MSLEDKQRYLKSQILEKGYDGMEFSSFLCNIKGEEVVDLGNWEFNELKDAVRQFQIQESEKKSDMKNEYQQPQIEQPIEPSNSGNNENTQNLSEQNENNMSPVPNVSENLPAANEEKKYDFEDKSLKSFQQGKLFGEYYQLNFFKEVPCRKLETNEISDREDLTSEVSNPQKVKEGVFSAAYFTYNVKIPMMNYNVVRKCNDFEFLSQKLSVFNPGVFCPNLPPKQIGLKDDSPKRLLYLQSYLNCILETKFFRSLPIVFDFFTLSQKDWDKKRNGEYKNLNASKGFDGMYNLKGTIDLSTDHEKTIKAIKIKDDIKHKTDSLHYLNTAFDNLLAMLEKTSEAFKKVSECFLACKKQYSDNKIIEKSFDNFVKITKIWSDDYLKQHEFIKDEIKYFYKFVHKENTMFNKNIDNFNNSHSEYKSKFEKLKKLAVIPDKEKDALKSLEVYYAFNLNMILDEYELLKDKHAKRIIKQEEVYKKSKNIIFQDYENCLKLIEFNYEEQS